MEPLVTIPLVFLKQYFLKMAVGITKTVPQVMPAFLSAAGLLSQAGQP